MATNTEAAHADTQPKQHGAAEIEHPGESEPRTESEKINDSEKGEAPAAYIPQSDEDYDVTFKTWIVVSILSASYGISFWIVPSLSACGAKVAADLGDPTGAAWFVAIYLMMITIAFMVCGANSDLFGRRWFIVGGNVLLFVGFFVGGAAKNVNAMYAAMAIIGFGAGNAQLAAFALPELLPNKWRHIAIVIADIGVFVAVVIGPIGGRYSAVNGDAWRWLFYAPGILSAFSFGGLYMYYFPPANPRGLPFKQALRELDYGGAFLFIAATILTLTGVNYTTFLPSNNPRVVGLLVSGLVVLLIFAVYETFVPLKQPLTPPRVFTRDHGRELTAPFIAAFVTTMYYYCINIVWPTMINVFFTDANTSLSYQVVLTLPGNLGLVFGGFLLSALGSKIGHWRWTLTASVSIMVVFGALLALGTPTRKGLMIALVFINQIGFGWAQYLTIAFVQFGTDQVELGIAGGLAGVARFAGGAVAVAVYTSILTNVQTQEAAKVIPPAVIAAGLPESSVAALMQALPLGAAALAKVPGITNDIAAAAGAAFQQSYVVGLRTTSLSALAFGVIAIIACICCQDIGKKMNNKIEIYLENDVHADRNKYH